MISRRAVPVLPIWSTSLTLNLWRFRWTSVAMEKSRFNRPFALSSGEAFWPTRCAMWVLLASRQTRTHTEQNVVLLPLAGALNVNAAARHTIYAQRWNSSTRTGYFERLWPKASLLNTIGIILVRAKFYTTNKKLNSVKLIFALLNNIYHNILLFVF